MIKKSHFWVNHNRYGDLIEIRVLDGGETCIEKWKFNINDKKTATKVMRVLKQRFGFSPEITNKSILEEEEDLKWLKGEN